MKRALALGTLGFLAAAVPAAAQVPPAPPLVLEGPRAVASGTAFELTGSAAPPGSRVQIEVRLRSGWRALAGARADAQGLFARRVRPARIRPRYLLRAVAVDGRVSERVRVRSRDVTLASVGDVNLGDLPGAYISRLGVRYPWTSVAPVLRRADVAFGNLECAISTRGFPVQKQFTFRGRPGVAAGDGRFAGFDVVNLANNHVGDYGTAAMLDTIDTRAASAWRPWSRRQPRLGVRAARGRAARPADRVRRLLGHPAGVLLRRPGPRRTQQATTENIRASVARAKRRADVVIATFHWGIERATARTAASGRSPPRRSRQERPP